MLTNKIKKKTVALYLPSLDIGGAERQVMELAKGLDKSKWQVLILTNWVNPLLTDELVKMTDVRIILLKKSNAMLYPMRLLAILYREKPCILNAYLVSSQMYTLLIRMLVPGIKVVFSIRDAKDCSAYNGVKDSFCMNTLKFGVSLVDIYLFNSEAGRKLRSFLPPEKVHVIRNGIDTARFAPDQSIRAKIQALTGIGDDAIIIGIVGNFSHYKGYDIFIRAAKIVAERVPHCRFVSIGNFNTQLGKEMIELVYKLQLSSLFYFLGSRNDVNRLVPGFDLFCSSSVTEGFSNAICEGMACGIPCVVTDVGDSASIVGNTGIVVPPENPEQLAAAIIRFVHLTGEERKSMGEAARARIEEKFSIARMVRSTEEVYDKLLYEGK